MRNIIVIFFILILVGCATTKTTPDQSINSFDVWAIEPKFVYDDISTPLLSDFEMDDCGLVLPNTSISTYDDYYHRYEKSGVRVTLYNLDGFIDGDGIITVIPRWDSLLNTRLFGPSDIAGGTLNSDYSLNPGEEFGGVGGEYFSRFHCLSDGSIIDLNAERPQIITKEEYLNIISNNYDMNIDSYLIMKSEKYSLEDKESIHGFVYIDNDSFRILEQLDKSFELITVSDDVICLKGQFDASGSKYLFYDLDENQIGSLYENAYGFSEGYAAVSNNGKWGYIDKTGNLIVDYIFEKALPIHDGCAWVKYDGRVGRLKIKEIVDKDILVNDELLDVQKYDFVENEGVYLEVIAERIRCREYPTVNSTHLTYANKGYTALVLRTVENEGYTWYQVLDSTSDNHDRGLWIADKNGEWIRIFE